MSAVSAVTAILLSAALFYAATNALFLQTEQTRATLVKVGLTASWNTPLAMLEVAGAIGLLVGIGVPPMGLAAAVGVVLFFTGAVIAHLRARDYSVALAAASGYLLLSATTLTLHLAAR